MLGRRRALRPSPRWSRIARAVWVPLALAAALVATPRTEAMAADASHARPSVAFFYAAAPPVDELRAYDWVVLQPAHVADPKALPAGTVWHAYVSVGELEPRDAARVPPAWLRGDNPDWGTQRVDHAAPGWEDFFARQVIAPLWQRGWRAFFLDTLDAHRAFATTEAARRAQEDALVAAVERLHRDFPGIRLIANRGFEWLPRVRGKVAAVAAESLYRGWDAGARRYVEVAAADRAWLAARLRKTAAALGVPAIAIDYVPFAARAQARETAARIRAEGFIPWVADAALGTLGVGDLELVPRRVLLVTDVPPGVDMMHTSAYRFLALPLHWLGYAIDPVDVQGPLPLHATRGTHAAVVTWFSQSPQRLNPDFDAWLAEQIQAGLRLVMFNFPAIAAESPLARALEVRAVATRAGPQPLARRDPRLGFETAPPQLALPTAWLQLANATQRWAQLGSGDALADAVAIAPWGGMALSPYAVNVDAVGDLARWVIDPIDFLFEALGRPDFPVPDVTTEAGRRLLLVHIDGDGFPSRAERAGAPFAGEVLEREVLRRYRIPHTVSVVQGEIAGNGLFAQLAPQLEDIARRIFALPHVEIASHSYSHPFQWQRLVGAAPGQTVEGASLMLPGYTFDLATEIEGSARYIDTRLAPPGKRTRVFLWTGDCLPPAAALDMARAAGLLNMNGGDTLITRDRPTLTLVAGLGIRRGTDLQVFAPNQNENLYTNRWRGPFWGYQRAIETFELTESPRRLKPVNIYYHTYSVTKDASLAALHRVYAWALAQPLVHVYASEYILKVHDFHRLAIARDFRSPRPAFRVRGAEALRTLRLPPQARIDLAASHGVAGAASGPAAQYLHLGSPDAVVVLGEGPVPPHVRDASGRIEDWQRDGRRLRFALVAHGAAEFTLAAARGCKVTVDGRPVAARAAGEDLQRHGLESRDAESTPRRHLVDVDCSG